MNKKKRKRFSVSEDLKYQYSDIGEYIDEGYTNTPLRNDKLVERLNFLYEELYKWQKEYEELSDKFYKKDFFEVKKVGKYTNDSKTFKNDLCVFNNRLGIAYSVTELVKVLNHMTDTIHDLKKDNDEKRNDISSYCIEKEEMYTDILKKIMDIDNIDNLCVSITSKDIVYPFSFIYSESKDYLVIDNTGEDGLERKIIIPKSEIVSITIVYEQDINQLFEDENNNREMFC